MNGAWFELGDEFACSDADGKHHIKNNAFTGGLNDQSSAEASAFSPYVTILTISEFDDAEIFFCSLLLYAQFVIKVSSSQTVDTFIQLQFPWLPTSGQCSLQIYSLLIANANTLALLTFPLSSST